MEWWKRISLSKRIIVHVALIEAITVMIGVMAIWYALGFQKTIDTLIGQNIEALRASREMESALANQKGFVTYYFLDGDPKWLRELAHYRGIFQNWLEKAANIDHDDARKALLAEISEHYRQYIQKKDRVIALYQAGNRQEGEQLHWEVRNRFFELNKLCQQYESVNEASIERVRENTRQKAASVSSFAVIGVIVSGVLGIFLAFLLIVQVIDPIRRLAAMAPKDKEARMPANEVALLSYRVKDMMADMDRTRTELKQSQEMLMHSEKMALVGKLATEVAHSIRSPMTSINMRLFSLQRNLELSENQKEDFEVVAEEMRRLDNIVRNFLEFSRPPKLHKKQVRIAHIIDMTLELLEYRLERHNVKVIRQRADNLPPVEADPELMKEVFVNLVVNACEAIGEEGSIFITEAEARAEGIGPALMVKIQDTGPGIPEDAREKILEPFHTTKSQGTGLGLFIVARIIHEHGGRLDLHSIEGEGAAFIITLPIVKEG